MASARNTQEESVAAIAMLKRMYAITRGSVPAPCSLTVGSRKEHFDAWNHEENDNPWNDAGRGRDGDGEVLSDDCAGALVRRTLTPRPVLNFLQHASELANSVSPS